MRRLVVLVALFLLCSFLCYSQTAVSYEVNTDDILHDISPYIYGVNGQELSVARSNRSGGNRLTGYNWETNVSNAGEDYFNHSDYYLPYIAGISEDRYDEPGVVITDFVDQCQAGDQFSLVTLPMAGFVAADSYGTVDGADVAPSRRWKTLKNKSPEGSVFDINDDVVYVDQELAFLISRYGKAENGGINAYSLDNEPALWPYTHPRIHPQPPTISELISKSIDLSNTIKSIDGSAEVFGPALYGFYAMYNLQDAPDWSSFQNDYSTFVDVYLDKMKNEEITSGVRPLDVLDVHWYPEPEGVYVGQTDEASASRRMQSVRSLWDPTYTEESWISNFLGEPIQMINRWQASIDTYYPGTKLAITEYDYGAADHISGGIAQVEALGAFAMKDIYFASRWNDLGDYVKAAFMLFRNYDGQGGTFGNQYISATSSDLAQSSIFASSSMTDNMIHLIVTNKSHDEDITASLKLNGEQTFKKADVFTFKEGESNVQLEQTVDVVDNTLTVTLPKLSASHIVISPTTLALNTNLPKDESFQVFPNPAVDHLFLSSTKVLKSIRILSIQGQTLSQKIGNNKRVRIPIEDLPSGMYFVEILNDKGEMGLRTFVK